MSMAVTSPGLGGAVCCAPAPPECVVIATTMAPSESRCMKDLSASFIVVSLRRSHFLSSKLGLCNLRGARIGEQLLQARPARVTLSHGGGVNYCPKGQLWRGGLDFRGDWGFGECMFFAPLTPHATNACGAPGVLRS